MRPQFGRPLRFNVMSTITLIAAMDLNRLIGDGDDLPWKLPADMVHFRKNTTGKPIIMGRNTFESIGRPLPKRRNLILSRRLDYQPSGTEVFHHLGAALDGAGAVPEIMVIGGSHVYGTALEHAQRMLLTVIHATFEGDVFFPEFSTNDWSIVHREDHEPDDKNAWAYSFLDLRRTSTGMPIPKNFPRGLLT